MGCAHGEELSSSSRLMCDNSLEKQISFSGLEILLYSDQHGSYITLFHCPDRAFGVDYSRTEISRDPNSKIARQMRINADFFGRPVRMTVSGFYEPAKEPELRRRLVIERIDRYVEQPNPY